MMNNPNSMMHDSALDTSELGKSTEYDRTYNPERLCAIPRAAKREEIGIDSKFLPFYGFDCWNHYEVSWLNKKGKPMIAIAEIYYDCNSPFIVESKSLKLYFNSLNNTSFKSPAEVECLIANDLRKIIGSDVTVLIKSLSTAPPFSSPQKFNGECLDEIDIECTQYTVHPQYLTTQEKFVKEVLYSDLLKSNCLVTQQPDWGSVQISYAGNKIDRQGLLKYLVSFRNHNEFHEQCIERVFVDIMNFCQPKELTVYGRYTRRGGIDINPYRSTLKNNFTDKNTRLLRQ